MPSSNDNIRFQVLVNGKLKATAGMESFGVLSLILSWVRRDPARFSNNTDLPPDLSRAEWIGNEVEVRLGGLDTTAQKNFEWFSKKLNVGDEITIRVLTSGPIDRPKMAGKVTNGKKPPVMKPVTSKRSSRTPRKKAGK